MCRGSPGVWRNILRQSSPPVSSFVLRGSPQVAGCRAGFSRRACSYPLATRRRAGRAMRVDPAEGLALRVSAGDEHRLERQRVPSLVISEPDSTGRNDNDVIVCRVICFSNQSLEDNSENRVFVFSSGRSGARCFRTACRWSSREPVAILVAHGGKAAGPTSNCQTASASGRQTWTA